VSTAVGNFVRRQLLVNLPFKKYCLGVKKSWMIKDV
jgi:hypothetical protein